MTAASAVRNVPLDKLVLSPTNVRKTPPSAAEDAELKASIRARGLKQNLVVHRMGEAKDMHAVVAGGRRLKALQELAAEGVIPADHKVPCLIEQPGQALETSLMENTIRAAMHPADEFVAMAALIEAGAAIEDVATRFGVSERHVRQRLRLGKLAPELLDTFRAGKISLELVTAFTLGADHAAQLAVWRQVKQQSYIQPYTVRHLLTETAVALDSGLGMFVGVAAYEAAGGKITRDLFSGDDDGFMDDAALVRRLAIEKLEAKAAELRVQWSWTKAVLDPEYGLMAQYGRVRPQPAELPPELAAEIERIDQRFGELEEVGAFDDWTDELAAEAARLEERRNEIDEIADGLAIYSEKHRARAGCIVTIGDDGEFCLHQGLVERAAIRGNAADDTQYDGDDQPATSDDDDEGSPTSPNAEQALRKECGYSQLLVDDLKAHRLQITRAHLAGDFAVAFDLALYALCVDLFDRFRYRSQPLELRATETAPRSSLNDLSGTQADLLLKARRSMLDLDWLALPPAESFAALAALSPDAKHRLFAWCIAACIKSAACDREPGRPHNRMRRPAARHPVRRLLAADRRQLLGPREESPWPSDRLGHSRRTLGTRSCQRQETGARGGARNRFRSRQEHRLHRSRPGGARKRRGVAAARYRLRRRCCGQQLRGSRARHCGSHWQRCRRRRRRDRHRIERPAGLPHRGRTRRRGAQRSLGALTRTFGTGTAHRRGARSSSCVARQSRSHNT